MTRGNDICQAKFDELQTELGATLTHSNETEGRTANSSLAVNGKRLPAKECIPRSGWNAETTACEKKTFIYDEK